MLRSTFALLALAAGSCAGVRADTFTFSFATTYLVQGGSGTLTADPYTGKYGETLFQVTSIQGTVDGVAITGLLPSSAFAAVSSPAQDYLMSDGNVIQYNPVVNTHPTTPTETTFAHYYFPEPGLSISAANGRDYNFASETTYRDLVYIRNADGSNLPTEFPYDGYPFENDITQITITPTPEPSSAVLLFTAMLFAGGFLWRSGRLLQHSAEV